MVRTAAGSMPTGRIKRRARHGRCSPSSLEEMMPEKRTLERARRAKRRGEAPSTQAGEFVREEIHHIRAGKHGARSTRQAIAIGLSKARRAGVALSPPAAGEASASPPRPAAREVA